MDLDEAWVGKNWEELGEEKICYMKNIYCQLKNKRIKQFKIL